MASMMARGLASFLFIGLVGAQGWVSMVSDPSALTWDEAQARVEVSGDVTRFLEECGPDKLRARAAKYAATRDKGVRAVAQHVAALAELARLPLPASTRDPVRAQLADLAAALNATFATTVGYAENVTMRGWPVRIKAAAPEFDAYQAGHAGEAVALAAERAALDGDHARAAGLARSVAAMLHDGFLTADLRRTKKTASGVVAYVPAGAPAGRRARYAALHPPWAPCLAGPQPLNHGLAAASAAVALRRACAAIDWSRAGWRLEDADGNPLDRTAFLADLDGFVAGAARVLLGALKVRETGRSSRDAYPGKEGTKWYKWKYRDVSECPKWKGGMKDRWEDITHYQYEVKFVANARALGRDYFGSPDYFGIESEDVRRFLVTALNRLVVDRAAAGGGRFGCDVAGATTDAKSCAASRAPGARHEAARYLLIAALAARDDPGAGCDAASLVRAVLPLFVEGHPEFFVSTNHRNCKQSVLLQAKYYFYHYEAREKDCLAGGS